MQSETKARGRPRPGAPKILGRTRSRSSSPYLARTLAVEKKTSGPRGRMREREAAQHLRRTKSRSASPRLISQQSVQRELERARDKLKDSIEGAESEEKRTSDRKEGARGRDIRRTKSKSASPRLVDRQSLQQTDYVLPRQAAASTREGRSFARAHSFRQATSTERDATVAASKLSALTTKRGQHVRKVAVVRRPAVTTS